MEKLRVIKNQITDTKGTPIKLRGVNLGGWMNLENFINGFPGSDHGIRAAFDEELGRNKANFFFNRLLDHFLTEKDIAFIKQCGANVVRVPLNYRNFENDNTPFNYLESGFNRLDLLLTWCAKHEVYAILDLHAVQGWQNVGWHSDNAHHVSLLWEHPHFQDRFVAIWEELARRYKDNPVVAGYNLMNEPASGRAEGRFTPIYSPLWDIMNSLYRRAVHAIRQIDSDHIIIIEGDRYSRLFSGLEAPFAPNLVYSNHMYIPPGLGPGPYPGNFRGEYWDLEKQRSEFFNHEGWSFSEKFEVPLYMGEFGSVYNGAQEDFQHRLRAVDDQIQVFEEQKIHWTMWTFKDLGTMGWVWLNPESEYMQVIRPTLQAKNQLDADLWTSWLNETPIKEPIRSLAKLFESIIADPEIDSEMNLRYLRESTLAGYVAALLQPTYARRFRGMTESQLDCVLQSFAIDHCVPNQGLLNIVKKHLCK